MYSGNHSPANPLKTLLQAAIRLKNRFRNSLPLCRRRPGGRKKEVRSLHSGTTGLTNSPFSSLSASFRTETLAFPPPMSMSFHWATTWSESSIPAKSTARMAVGRPILYFGPNPSHVMDLLDAHPLGLQASPTVTWTERSPPSTSLKAMSPQDAEKLWVSEGAKSLGKLDQSGRF